MTESLVGEEAQCTTCARVKKIVMYQPKHLPSGIDENLCIDCASPLKCERCGAYLSKDSIVYHKKDCQRSLPQT